MNETSMEKRKSVKNDYDIIAAVYAEEFGKKYEDIEVSSKNLLTTYLCKIVLKKSLKLPKVKLEKMN